jgi:probable RNA-binding protein EIF1AD
MTGPKRTQNMRPSKFKKIPHHQSTIASPPANPLYTEKMGRRPKRHILADASSASTPPTSLPPTHRIARVVRARGNAIFAVTLAGANQKDEPALAELAGNLRSTFWIRRGAFVVVDGAALAARENKLVGEIVTVIMEVKKWRKMGYWPVEFRKADEESESDEGPGMPPEEDEDEVEGSGDDSDEESEA